MRTKVQPKKKTAKTAAKKTTPKRRTTRSKQTAAPKKAASTAKKEKAAKKPSALDAAAKVLESSKTSMTTSELIDAMAEKKLWSSPGGKTPDRTLYSAILREIATKGKDARFKKTERGKFALAAK